MKKPSRFLRVFGVAGLLLSLLAATVAPVGAQDDDENGSLDDLISELLDVNGGLFRTGDNAIFYPWVANGDDFGLGASHTSISVQNLDGVDGAIAIFVGDGDGGFTLETTAFLSAYAAKTFHAHDLGIEEGTGAPVAVIGFDEFTSVGEVDDVFDTLEPGEALVETAVILSKPEGVEGDFTQVVACVINDGSGNPVGFAVAADFTFDGTTYTAGTAEAPNYFVGAFTQADLQAILEDGQAGSVEGELVNPFGGFNNDGDCSDEGIAGSDGGDFLFGLTIGGVAKQATTGDSLPTTTEADTAVSGYNAINGVELAQFEQFYLPIVQTNCGPGGCWDTVIRVGNLANENNAVTIRFFPADDGSGSLQTGFQIQDNVDGGSTWNVNLSDLVPEGWVGSAHILSDGGVFAMADRYKVGYNMWITNTGSSSSFEANFGQAENAQGDYVLFAPHVLLDYFGWNTGINVANLVETDNNVSVQYFNLLGNATEVLNQRLAAHGMTYFYDPSVGAQDDSNQDVTNDPNANTVGSALIWSDEPVAAVVDATKYPETDPNGGADLFQATSYSATANVFTTQFVPLVQKGSPVDGLGDTSGINVMNPNSTAATVVVNYVNPSGFDAQNFGTSSVTVPGFATGFVYTMTQRNLPNGFTGAAHVVSSVPVAAVSANVNYAVDGDGSAIFNAFNPCGLFRASGDGEADGIGCSFGDVFAPGGQSVSKTFIVDDGDDEDETSVGDAEGVAGVDFSIVSTTEGVNFQRNGISGTSGSLTFENVPVGNYELFVDSVPDGFVAPDPTVAQDTFTVTEGADVSLINELESIVVIGDGSLVKFVCDELNTSDVGCDLEQNEIQELSTITNGSFGFQDCEFQLEFDGETTSELSCFTPSTIAEVQSALEALPNIGAGNVSVTGGPILEAPIQIEFIGAFVTQNIEAQVTVVNIQNAVGGTNTVIQDGRESTVFTGGTVQVFVATEDSDLLDDTTWGDEVTDGPQATGADGSVAFDLTAGTYIVCADAPTALAENCEFAEVTEDGETVLVNNLDLAGAIEVLSTTGQNEIQELTQPVRSTDSFSLTFSDGVTSETTGPLVGLSSGFQVQTALESLGNVPSGSVACTGSTSQTSGAGYPLVCEFVNELGSTDLPTMIANNTGTANIAVASTQEGAASGATISADALVSGGTFTLTFATETTASIAWNATAAEIEAALEALSTVGVGNVEVSGGPLPNADVTVLFVGTLAGTASSLTVDNTDLS